MAQATPLAADDRPLVLRTRADLRLAPVVCSGCTTYVAKDPLTTEMVQLTGEEAFLLESLRQPTSLKALQTDFERRFAPQRITTAELQQALNQLYSQGLLLSEAAGQGEELRRRADRQRRAERWQSWLKVLSFRLGSIDATKLIDGLHRRLRWLFSWPIMLLALLVCMKALSLLAVHHEEFVLRLPSLGELAQPRYWPMWLVTIAGVKVVHELAHALTCKHYGGRCHEMGVLVLALVPCLYCDVSDVWRLPSKWQRIAVSAAGMLAELVLAALALIIWWYAEPGLMQTLALSVVITCSVGTLLVNLNPLLRYDGYYILSDLCEVPNLSTRAQGLLPAAVRRWLLNEPPVSDPLLSPRQRRGLWLYAIASRLYLVLVVLGIFAVLLTWARPHRLENLVYTLGVVILAGMAFPLAMGVWRMTSNPSLRYRMRPARVASLLLLLLCGLVFFFYWPISRTVTGPAVFVPLEGKPVYVTTAGELEFALPAGTRVEAGDIVARVASSEVRLAVARQRGQLDTLQAEHRQLATLRSSNELASRRIPTTRAAFDAASQQLDQLEAEAEELTLRAPRSGVLVSPPRVVPEGNDAAQLATWSGSPLDERNLGSWLEPGTLVGVVGDPQQLEALVAIDERDIAELAVGQEVSILLDASPLRVLTGEVVQVGRRGERRDESASSPTADRVHLVEVRLTAQDPLLLVGARGTAKIVASRQTLSERIWQTLSRQLRLPW